MSSRLLLRGGGGTLSSTVVTEQQRWISDTTTMTDTTSDPNNNDDNQSFSIMLAVLVGLILLFFVVCIYQIFKMWFLNLIWSYREDVDPTTDPNVMIVHQGRAFNLNEHQRRAILETIFSSSSKVR